MREEERGGWVYEMHALAANHRLSDLGAALGASQLARLDQILDLRRTLARRYTEVLSGESRVDTLAERPGTRSAWHLYPIQIDRSRVAGGRATVHRRLHEAGVGAQVHYIPIHLQPWYRRHLGTRFGDLPATEAAYLRLLSLPLYPELGIERQDRVLAALSLALDAEGER
jgi:dTDP-4-amino-4,6-dideoxygalactose transaminase